MTAIGAGIGLKIIGLTSITQHAVRLDFLATNNVAKYEALLYGLQVAWAEGAMKEKVHTNSLLIAQQENKVYQVKEPQLQLFLDECFGQMKDFDSVEVVHIARADNPTVDALSKLVSSE